MCQADIVPRGSDSTTCHYYAKYHSLILNLILKFLFLSQFSSNFCKNETILSQLKLRLNLLFYKSYGDILTKINIFIKYFYKYFKLTLNST